MTKLRVGLMVHFYSDAVANRPGVNPGYGHNGSGAGPYPAMITQVFPDASGGVMYANMKVFPPFAPPFDEGSVSEGSEKSPSRYWVWPQRDGASDQTSAPEIAMRQPEYAYTGPHPEVGGYVGFVNIRKDADGENFIFSVRSEGHDPVQAQCAIPADKAVTLLADAVLGLGDREAFSTVSDAQVKHMVDRFLSWRLPENFNPDCGIHFDADAPLKLDPRNLRYEPTGTNLFDATQAEAMVRHMLMVRE